MKKLSVSSTTFKDHKYYVMKVGTVIVSIAYLGKRLKELCIGKLKTFRELGGKTTIMYGKNVITFQTREDAEKGLEYLRSLFVMEQLV